MKLLTWCRVVSQAGLKFIKIFRLSPTFYNKIAPMVVYSDFDLDQALVYCKNLTIGCRYFNSLI